MHVDELTALLDELERLLLEQGDRNWTRGVANVRALLNEPEGLQRAARAWRAMNAGAGTFSDYNVWHSELQARIAANAPIDSLRDRLWKGFDL